MAVDGYLKIDGVKGESKDKDHKGEIDILDVHWNLAQPASMAYGGGGGTGKVDFHDISFTKRFDFSSPTLMAFCANGKHIPNGIVTLRKAGENPLDYLKITLEDIIVSSVTPSGLGSGDGHEHLSLNFAKITMDYTEQDEKGGKGSNNRFSWDNKQHQLS